MAPYATPADLRRHLTGSSTAAQSGVGAQPDAALTDAISQGQAQVDGVLVGRHRLPLFSPPRLVVDITLAVAAWHATLAYRGEVDLVERDPVALRYAWAERQLDGIAKGTVDLQIDGDADGVPDPTPAGRPSGFNTVPHLFGPDDFHLTDQWGSRRGR